MLLTTGHSAAEPPMLAMMGYVALILVQIALWLLAVGQARWALPAPVFDPS